jgi:hypothetical protein
MGERERMRGFFERRGREGYAKGAKEEKKKEKQDEIKKANKAQINPLKQIFLSLNFLVFFSALFA